MSQRMPITSNAPLAPYPPMNLSQQQAAVPSKSALSPSPQYSTGSISSSISMMGRGAGGESGSGTASEISDQATPAFTAGDLPIKSSARAAQNLPSMISMVPSWNNVAACINCVESRSIPSLPLPPRNAPVVASSSASSSFATPATPVAPTPPRNRKLGPLLLELRQVELAKKHKDGGITTDDDDDDDDVFFTTRRIAVSRGNPSLGSSVASTCLDLPIVKSYSPNINHVAAAATGLSTGMLCIHTFGFGRDGSADGGGDGDNDGGDDNLLTSSIEYYHTPRHHRQASAVAWRPTNHNHVAIGLLGSNTSAGGHHHHQQQAGARRSTVSMSRAGGDREFCCVIFDIESQQSSSTKRNSTPMSKLSHNAPVASLAWMMDGQTLAVGLQSRTVQLYDMRVPAGSNVPPISAYAHNFGVHGIEVDPHRPHMMATYCRSVGEAVKIWDCRRMDSAFSEIKIGGSGSSSSPTKASSQSASQSLSQTKVESVKWSILDPGIISVAIGDSVQDYDTNSSSSRPVLMRVNYSRKGQSIRDMALFGGSESASNKKQQASLSLSSMQRNDGLNYDEIRTSDKLIEALYPRRMLTVLDDRTVCDMARHTIAPLEISRRDGRLVHSLGSKIWVGSTTSGPSAIERSEISNDDDISATMMRRARCSRVARYSMDTASNIKLLSEELQKVGDGGTSDVRLSLLRLWSWVERVESLCIDAEDMEDDIRFWPAKGLLDSGIWQLLGLDQEASGSPVEDVCAYSDLLSCPIYDSPARRYALTSCGWVGKFDLPNVLGECETLGEYERSAALAVWHGDIGAAVNALQRASDSIRRQDGRAANLSDNGTENEQSYAETLDLVAMCLAGFGASSSSSVWENACSSLLRRDDLSESKAISSQKAYLRGLCQYLLNVGEKGCNDQVLYNSKLSLSDRVAFACRFLDPKSLKDFLLHCIESTHATGNVEGLVVTGLSKEGIRCIQSFVDRYSDVQSAALVCSRTILPAEWGIERKICLEWVEAYRGLLNTWQMWQSRSMFDVDRAEHLRRIKARGVDGAIVAANKAGNFPGGRRSQIPPNRRQGGRVLDLDVVACIPAQLDARCNYCSAPLGLRRNEGGRNQWLSKMKSILSCCPQCRKPLPRCAICLLPMGCLNPYMELTRERSRTTGLLRKNSLLAASQDDLSQVSNLPFAEWFTWCMRCKHGGHAHHLVGWFANHDVCPVSGCNCQCEFDGIQKLSRPASP